MKQSKKERLDWFVNRVNKELGMTAVITRRYKDDEFNIGLTYYSPTSVRLGGTTFSASDHLFDNLFGIQNGLFLSEEVNQIVRQIMKDYGVIFNPFDKA